ncbi:MAG: hypothetical protein QMD14_04515 [Candidatus Aenigmarchaeota archaeon]|nr:hypothetical protein [Candidatus Aenigmarchaeota archaeon]
MKKINEILEVANSAYGLNLTRNNLRVILYPIKAAGIVTPRRSEYSDEDFVYIDTVLRYRAKGFSYPEAYEQGIKEVYGEQSDQYKKYIEWRKNQQEKERINYTHLKRCGIR